MLLRTARYSASALQDSPRFQTSSVLVEVLLFAQKKPSRIRGGFGSVENGKAMRYLAASPSWS